MWPRFILAVALAPAAAQQARGAKPGSPSAETIRALEIPIGEVLASPYCRTRETAEPAFGRAYVVERKFMSATDGRGGFAHFATIVPGDWPRLVSLSHR